ncbi:Protease, Ulp1 family [Ceraceosorus bombacis]|uniref:Protease, Ulp1 family n=1 Tax=Ceraceosorus bombacis TaxID=401625 RepID=A0A0P1BFA9_9BASI|nr:Protease, Ulp1 family [Ceraceosorus bombacis]
MVKRRRKTSNLLDVESTVEGAATTAANSDYAQRNAGSSSALSLASSRLANTTSSAQDADSARQSDQSASQGNSGRLRRFTSRVSSVFSKFGSPRKRQRVDSLPEGREEYSGDDVNRLAAASRTSPKRILEMRSVAPSLATLGGASPSGSQTLPRPALRPAPSVREIAKLFKDDEAIAAEEKSVHFPSGLASNEQSAGNSPTTSREEEGELSYIDEQEIDEVERSLIGNAPEEEEESESGSEDVELDRHREADDDGSGDDEPLGDGTSEPEGSEAHHAGEEGADRDARDDDPATDDDGDVATHQEQLEGGLLTQEEVPSIEDPATLANGHREPSLDVVHAHPLNQKDNEELPDGEQADLAAGETGSAQTLGEHVLEAPGEIMEANAAKEAIASTSSRPSILTQDAPTPLASQAANESTSESPLRAASDSLSMPVPAKLVSALSPHTRSPRFNKMRSRVPQRSGSALASAAHAESGPASVTLTSGDASVSGDTTAVSATKSGAQAEIATESSGDVNGALSDSSEDQDRLATTGSKSPLYPDLSTQSNGHLEAHANGREAVGTSSALYPDLSADISDRVRPVEHEVEGEAEPSPHERGPSTHQIGAAGTGSREDEEEGEEDEEEDESILIPRLSSTTPIAQRVRRTGSLRSLSESASQTLANWAGRASQVASEAIADAVDAAGVPVAEGEESVILHARQNGKGDVEENELPSSDLLTGPAFDDTDTGRQILKSAEQHRAGASSSAESRSENEVEQPRSEDHQSSPSGHSDQENRFDPALLLSNTTAPAGGAIDLTGDTGDEVDLRLPLVRPGLPRKASLIPRPALTEIPPPLSHPRAPRKSAGHIPQGPPARLHSSGAHSMGRSPSVLSDARESSLVPSGSAIASIQRLGGTSLRPSPSPLASSIRGSRIPRRVGGYKSRKKDPIGMKEHLVLQAERNRQLRRRHIKRLTDQIQRKTNYTQEQVQERLDYQFRTDHAADVEKRGRAFAEAVPPEERVLRLLQADLDRLTRAQRSKLQPSRSEQKTLNRLVLEEKLREKRLRGILGRQPMPDRLDEEQEREVRHILADSTFEKQISGAIVNNRNLQRLKPGQWLDDESINFYAVLINNRSNDMRELRAAGRAAQKNLALEGSRADLGTRKALEGERKRAKKAQGYWDVHAFQTHMFVKIQREGHAGVKRWTKKVDVFSKDRIIFPVNRSNSHWVTAAINLRQRRFEFYDSMTGGWAHDAAHALMAWLEAEWLAKKASSFDGRTLDTSGWYVYDCPTNPQQENGSDCGVFTVLMMEHLSRRDPWLPFPDPPALDLVQMLDASQQEAAFGRDASLDEDLREMEWNFAQSNVPYYRRRMIWELGNATLLE